MGLEAEIELPVMEKAKTHKFISKKWVNDHWEYKYPQDNAGRRVNHANQVELITGIKPLKVTPGDVDQIIKSYEQTFRQAVRNGLKCKWIQNRKVDGFVAKHLTRKQGYTRPIHEVIDRVRLLPFVLPVIQRYGHISHVGRNPSGGYDYELVGKAEINGKKYAITVIMSDDRKNPKNLVCVSLFGFTRNMIKSLATAGGLDQEECGIPASSIGKWTSSPNHNLIIPQISAKSIGYFPNLEVSIQNITPENRKVKFAKAIKAVSKHLKVPVDIGHKHTGEPYLYPIQQELSDQWTGYYSGILKKIYKAVVEALDLPPVEVETMRKALGDSGILRYHGKVIYNPETGQPLKNKDFDDLIEGIQKFLNRNTKDISKQILLDSAAIEKLLRRMAKYQSSPDMARLKLDTMKYRGKTFDWIRSDIKNLESVTGKLSAPEMARYQVAQDYVAELVTRSNRKIRDEIKDTVLRGIIEKRTKAQVSQDLFNRMGGLNRDWKRIADTEIVNTSNLAGILQEVNETPKGEKVYFKRYELPGCCDKCEKVNGKVVLWSDSPLDEDKIKDPYTDTAIWEGKSPDSKKCTLVPGTLHPNCRGGWLRWGGKQVDAMIAQLRGKAEVWDSAVGQAREEYREKGAGYPNDQTPGYVDRINEIYREKLGEGEAQTNETRQETRERREEKGAMSPERMEREATRLAYEQAHKEWDSAGKSKKNRGTDGEFFDRLRELYLKNCAESGVEPAAGAFSREARDYLTGKQ
jgi:hypothetical protein